MTEGEVELESTESEVTETEKPNTVREDIQDAISLLKNKEQPEDNGSGERSKSAREALETAKTQNPEQKARKAPRRKTVEISKAGAAEQAEPQQSQENYEPPAQFNVQEKEWFKRQAPETKRAITRMVNGMVSSFTRSQQDTARVKHEASEMLEAIKPHLTSWGLKGVSPGQAVRQLTAVQNYLVQKREDAFVELADGMKLDRGLLIRKLGGGNQQQGDPNQAQQNNSNANTPQWLTEELQESRMFREQLIQAAQQQQHARVYQAGQSIAGEIKSVMDETDGAGNYRYPKLHDDSYRNSLEPLLLALRQNHPRLSWAEITKRAYLAVEGSSGFPPNQPAQRVSVNPTQKRNASISVRGRSTGNGSPIPRGKPGESVSDSVRRAIQLTRRDNY